MALYERLPWFKFFVVDWMTDPLVCSLNLAQQGLFLRLLCVQWREGSLPSGLEQLRRLAGVGSGQWDRGGGDTEDIFHPRQSMAADEFTDIPLHSFIDTAFPKSKDGKRCNAKLEMIRKELMAAYEARAKGGKHTKGIPHRLKRSAFADNTLSARSLGEDSDIDPTLKISSNSSGDLAIEHSSAASTKPRTRRTVVWDDKEKRCRAVNEEWRTAFHRRWQERLGEEKFGREVDKANAWLDSRPQRRTEAAKLDRFLDNWMLRSIE